MAWITPITNWDGVTVSPNRKYFNLGDFNRIEGNTDAVLDLIETFAARPTTDTIKTDWNNQDFPFYDQLNRIEDNVEDIKEQTAEPLGWVAPVTDWASGENPDFNDANRIEGNLLALYTMANSINDAFLHCGDPLFICGKGSTLF